MQNARTAHALAHWRFHLNEWVIDYLRNESYLTADKIVQRDGWSVRKRRKAANKIADRMETEGEVKRLYRDFRHEISTAQFANVSGTQLHRKNTTNLILLGQLLRYSQSQGRTWQKIWDFGNGRFMIPRIYAHNEVQEVRKRLKVPSGQI